MASTTRAIVLLGSLGLGACAAPVSPAVSTPHVEDSLAGSWRRDRDGWKWAHLQGTPAQIGFAHGSLFAQDIEEAIILLRKLAPTETGRPWTFYRDTSERIIWPQVPDELRAELQAIARGVSQRRKGIDLWDIVAENAFLEIAGYYIPSLTGLGAPLQAPVRAEPTAPSAVRTVPGTSGLGFVAIGKFTRGGKLVLGHSARAPYATGRLWNVLLEVAPDSGQRFLMTTMPGLIFSIDGFYLTDAGLMVAAVPLAQFHGFDPLGIPCFVRARSAAQRASSLDDWLARMSRNAGGGLASDWLVGDRIHRQIARLEQGLRHQKVWRSSNGVLFGGGGAGDPELAAHETGQDPKETTALGARERLLSKRIAQLAGKLDMAEARRLLSDHTDADDSTRPSAHTLCSHGEEDVAPRPEWGESSLAPSGTILAQVTDSDLAADLSTWAIAGRPCQTAFSAESFLAARKEYGALEPVLRDLPAAQWSELR